MPQLKNRHDENCLFPISPLRTYVPKRVCAFTRTRRHMHRVQLINAMALRLALAYAPCCSRCRLSGVRSRLHVCGYFPERAHMYMTSHVCGGRVVARNWCIMQSGLPFIIALLLFGHIAHERQDAPSSILPSFLPSFLACPCVCMSSGLLRTPGGHIPSGSLCSNVSRQT